MARGHIDPRSISNHPRSNVFAVLWLTGSQMRAGEHVHRKDLTVQATGERARVYIRCVLGTGLSTKGHDAIDNGRVDEWAITRDTNDDVGLVVRRGFVVTVKYVVLGTLELKDACADGSKAQRVRGFGPRVGHDDVVRRFDLFSLVDDMPDNRLATQDHHRLAGQARGRHSGLDDAQRLHCASRLGRFL